MTDFIEQINNQGKPNRLKQIENQEKDLIDNLKKLNVKLDDLSNFKVEVKQEDRIIIEGLKEYLKATNEQLNDVRIPAEIKVINETKISLNDKTRLFLIFSFSFAFLISIGSVWYSNYRVAEIDKETQILIEENIKNSIPLEDQKWFVKFYQYQSKTNPKDTQKFKKENPM